MELRWKLAAAKIFVILLLTSVSAFALKDEDKVIFKKQTMTLVSGKVAKKITVEVAETDDQHERGLMFRKDLAKDNGMLFVFGDEMTRSFWMKNTLIDLSIGYFNKDKKLVDVQEMKAVTSILQQDIPSYPSQAPAQYALEMSAKWFTKNRIEKGAVLKLKGEK